MSRPGLVGTAANLALLGATCAAIALGVELVLAPALLHRLPLALHGELLPPLGTLAQSSKAATLPRDYVALVGDSHAQGEGDWHLGVDAGGNPPFHSAHLIHQQTGRDVLSFGRAGAGSLRGLVTEPVMQLRYLKKTARYAPEDPRDILVYFYEGNDLDDNLFHLRRRYQGVWDETRLFEPAYFRSFIEAEALTGSMYDAPTEAFAPWHNLFVLRSLRHRFDAWRRRERREAERRRGIEREVALDPPKHPRRRPPNRFHSGGEVIEVRRKLQSPALALSEEEIETGLYVFEQALATLVEHFPESRAAVVYVPSPLASYRLAAERVSTEADHYWDRPQVYPAAFVAERSRLVCEGVAARAARHGAGFVDARPHFRRAAEGGAVHGPVDWKHPNRRGYEALARAAVDVLEGRAPAGCAATRALAAPAGS